MLAALSAAALAAVKLPQLVVRGAQPQAPRLALAPGVVRPAVVNVTPLPRPVPRRPAPAVAAIPSFVPTPVVVAPVTAPAK